MLRIAAELVLETVYELPASVKTDISAFIDSLSIDPFDSNSLKNYGVKNEEVIELLHRVFDWQLLFLNITVAYSQKMQN